MDKKKNISVALSEEQFQKLQELAEESCRTRAGYVWQIIRRYLREIELDPDRKID